MPERTGTAAEDAEISIIAVAGTGEGTQDLDILASVVVAAPDYHYERNRELILARNGPPLESGPVDTYPLGENAPDGSRISVVPDETFAIGSFLHLLEVHDLDESECFENLTEQSDAKIEEYIEWRDGLTLSDRRHRLLDQIEQEIDEEMGVTKPVLEEGSFRPVGLTEEGRARAEYFFDTVDSNPKHCFKNCLKAKRRSLSDETLQYCEGIALPKSGTRIIMHAWLEIDERVAEMTWPWHAVNPPEETVYFGRSVSAEKVRKADITTGEPLLLDVDADMMG